MDASLKHWRNPTYGSWLNMRRRCKGSDRSSARNYHARGITYDAAWESFDTFLSDMGPRPDGTTLDRIDNDAGYSKDNCRWATRKTQQNNRRNTRHVTWRGETCSAREWERRLGFKKSTINTRLLHGWPVERALTAPVRGYTCSQ